MERYQLQVKPDRRDSISRDQLTRRVQAEFVEMRCLRLTFGQAQRLFGLRDDVCERILAALVAEHTLCRDAEGRYRLDERADIQPIMLPNKRFEVPPRPDPIPSAAH